MEQKIHPFHYVFVFLFIVGTKMMEYCLRMTMEKRSLVYLNSRQVYLAGTNLTPMDLRHDVFAFDFLSSDPID